MVTRNLHSPVVSCRMKRPITQPSGPVEGRQHSPDRSGRTYRRKPMLPLHRCPSVGPPSTPPRRWKPPWWSDISLEEPAAPYKCKPAKWHPQSSEQGAAWTERVLSYGLRSKEREHPIAETQRYRQCIVSGPEWDTIAHRDLIPFHPLVGHKLSM